MKKVLPLLFVLAASAVLAGCQDGDSHGVIFDRGGFLSNLFGATPTQSAPNAQATPVPAAAPANS